MQYKKLTFQQKKIKSLRNRAYAMASEIQDAATARGVYISRDNALQLAWATVRQRRKPNQCPSNSPSVADQC